MKSKKKWIAAMCSILLSSSMLTPAAFAVEVQSNEARNDLHVSNRGITAERSRRQRHLGKSLSGKWI